LLADLGFKKVYSIAEGFEGDKAKTGAHAILSKYTLYLNY